MSAESAAASHVDQFGWWQGNYEVPEPINKLRDLATLRQAVEDQIRASVAEYRHMDGMTWSEIGDALGVTKQAAQARYGVKSNS